MRAYKFLRVGGVGRFSDVAWPLPADDRPGSWIEVDGPLETCARGVHGCREQDLLDWIDDALWEVKLVGEIRESGEMLIAERGRLIRRIDGWDDAAARDFAIACNERARVLAMRSLRRLGLTDDADRIVQEVVETGNVPPLGAPPENAEALGFAGDAAALARGHRPETSDIFLSPAVEQPPAATAANVAYVVAHAAGREEVAEVGDESAHAAGFAAERAWQLAWLRSRLGLGSRSR